MLTKESQGHRDSFYPIGRGRSAKGQALFAFIEHDQDRGLNPSRVHTHMKVVKAVVRFLIGEGGHPR